MTDPWWERHGGRDHLILLEPTPRTALTRPRPTAAFVGSINTTAAAPVNGNGVLSVANGNTITVRYIDADDGAGGVNVQRQDTASVDCVPPVISNVASSNVTGNSATITWTTNEAADSLATAGTGTPPSGNNASDATLVTSHSVNLTGLSECTTYKYLVTSADAAGNSATATNGGAYYTFSTGKNVNPTYASTNVPVAIPDNNPTGASSTLTVADTKVIQDVEVLVNITHT